jgi:hypothetical protein
MAIFRIKRFPGLRPVPVLLHPPAVSLSPEAAMPITDVGITRSGFLLGSLIEIAGIKHLVVQSGIVFSDLYKK